MNCQRPGVCRVDWRVPAVKPSAREGRCLPGDQVCPLRATFDQIGSLIEACPVVQSSKVTYDKRTRHTGFIRGELFFVDGSMLHLREFVDVEDGVDRFTYVYQYMDADSIPGFPLRQHRPSQEAQSCRPIRITNT
jgi:hypothetical protein